MDTLNRSELRLLRSLQTRRGRERRGLLLLEGVRAVATALDVSSETRLIVVTDEVAPSPDVAEVLRTALGSSVPVRRVTPDLMVTLTDTRTPSGILAVLGWAPRRAPESEAAVRAVREAGARSLLCLDAVADPGNVGTLLRTAEVFGVGGVVLGRGTVEVSNPKVARSAVGSLLGLPLVLQDVPLAGLLKRLSEEDWDVLRAEAAAGEEVGAAVERPWALVLGSEAHGTGPEVGVLGRAVHLPMAGAAGSLNVAVAGGILLYLLTRKG